MSYRDLATAAQTQGRDVNLCMAALSTKTRDWPKHQVDELSAFLWRTFLPSWYQKWKAAHRKSDIFDKKNREWLAKRWQPSRGTEGNGPVEVTIEISDNLGHDRGRGRPTKGFAESSERTKRRRIKETRDGLDPELLRRVSITPRVSADRAIMYMLDNDFTKAQYDSTRELLKEHGLGDFLPAYNHVRHAKAVCVAEGVEITESHSSVPLSSLLEHTARRLLESKSESELEVLHPELTLVAKWGCDGSSNHSIYKQKFAAEDRSDASMFLSSMVPLQIHSRKDRSKSYWVNPRSSSTRLCRPIKFQFAKETESVIREEVRRVEKEISNLKRTEVVVKNRSFFFEFEMIFCMVDGKVLQVMNDTSWMSQCSICKAKPKEMNDLDLMRSKAAISAYASMSPLHARIKFMECLLKISYVLPIVIRWNDSDSNEKYKWGKKLTVEQAALKKATKEEIQSKFEKKLGLHIDKVRQNFGNSNDGNTSRRFFANPSETAEILKVDEELIGRFRTILDTINCTHQINVEEFERYTSETAQLYVSLYPWYPMNNTVHKVLLHGTKMISDATFPIGMLSEEAQEAENKIYRHIRLHHTRKCSRTATNEDLMKYMLARSDPYLYNLKRTMETPLRDLHEDVQKLLKDASLQISQ